jgi:hypothetical protein
MCREGESKNNTTGEIQQEINEIMRVSYPEITTFSGTLPNFRILNMAYLLPILSLICYPYLALFAHYFFAYGTSQK